MGCVYIARNKINGKAYIGKTIKALLSRQRGHKYEAQKGGVTYFQRAIRKYGFDNFEWEKLHESNDNDELRQIEIKYIQLFDTKLPNGYNITDGGDGTVGRRMSDSQRQGLRDRVFSEATRKLMSISAKKKPPISAETRAKSRAIRKGTPLHPNALKGLSKYKIEQSKKPKSQPKPRKQRSPLYLEGEIWKDAPKFEGRYQVSSFSRVRSTGWNIWYKNQKGKHISRMAPAVIVIPYLLADGYYHITLDSEEFKLHTIVALTFVPNPKGLPYVYHKDRIKTNDRMENLDWIDKSGILKLSYTDGVMPKGSESRRAKLTEADVITIRQRIINESPTKIAKDYPVCQQTITDIGKRKIWKHLP